MGVHNRANSVTSPYAAILGHIPNGGRSLRRMSSRTNRQCILPAPDHESRTISPQVISLLGEKFMQALCITMLIVMHCHLRRLLAFEVNCLFAVSEIEWGRRRLKPESPTGGSFRTRPGASSRRRTFPGRRPYDP